MDAKKRVDQTSSPIKSLISYTNATVQRVGLLAASTPKACPKKATELWYVTHPKVPKAMLGPFLSQADAECGHVVMRSADAVVTACPIDSLDDLTYWHAANNGQICRAFTGAAKEAV